MKGLPFLAVILLAGCGEPKTDVSDERSPSASSGPVAPVNSTKSNPVAGYKTSPAGQGDALK